MRFLVAGFLLGVFVVSARADVAKALVVGACGTPPSNYGQPYQRTQDGTGTLCAEATCSVSTPNTYSPGTTRAVLVDSNGRTCVY